METQHSVSPLRLHDLLRESFNFLPATVASVNAAVYTSRHLDPLFYSYQMTINFCRRHFLCNVPIHWKPSRSVLQRSNYFKNQEISDYTCQCTWKSCVIHCDDVSKEMFLTRGGAFRFELALPIEIPIWNACRAVRASEEIQLLEYGEKKKKHQNRPLLSLMWRVVLA
jgi:hypothetical protein